MPLTDDLVSVDRFGSEFVHNLVVYWCHDCRTAQTLHDVEMSDYYRDYRYTVSASPFACRFMRRLAEQLGHRFGVRRGDRVIEIGSGDGFQLKCFQNLGAEALGFEPSESLAKTAESNGVPTIQTLFDSGGIDRLPSDMRQAQVLLLTYTLDHLPEPRGFPELAHKILDPDRGLLVVEVHDFAEIVSRCEMCLLEHEHTVYLTSVTMQRFLDSCGFQLLCTDLLPDTERRGNSLLVVAAPKTSRYDASCHGSDTGQSEFETYERMERFRLEVETRKETLRRYIANRKAEGKTLGGYGAGGRGVLTLAMAGITSTELEYVCDQNSSFHGLYTPVTHVPVVSPAHVDAHHVDELLVFSYAYMDEIAESLGSFIGRGGKLTSFLDIV